ncbi:hypothetical protein ALQ18_02249, partial [Pseudomonas marginalis pv. marginalis]
HSVSQQERHVHRRRYAYDANVNVKGNLATLDVAEIDNPLRFQGQYFDAETGLHYNRRRYYNPGSGRFLTPDPIKLASGLNNYQYVPNPTVWVDQLGLSPTCSEPSQKRPTNSANATKPDHLPMRQEKFDQIIDMN